MNVRAFDRPRRAARDAIDLAAIVLGTRPISPCTAAARRMPASNFRCATDDVDIVALRSGPIGMTTSTRSHPRDAA